jgi:UDP-2,3-diacylglucosamine pyrophosphatase LpxH
MLSAKWDDKIVESGQGGRMNRSLVIISDLHMSNGPLEDFDEDLEGHLVSFLKWLTEHEDPFELVVNGDFLDFVQAVPYSGRNLESATDVGIPLCFSEEQSLEKFDAIRRAHPMVFSALRAFLSARDENRLVILPGNHDPDFFWQRVRDEFAAAVCPVHRPRQVSFCLSRGYRPPQYPWLWIEHGHQYDPVNSFFVAGEERWGERNPPIFIATDGIFRLYECTGTRFMIRYLNALDAKYPYVDNVKPFSRFIRIFGASALIPGWGPLNAAIAVSQMISYLARTAAGRPQDLLNVEAPDGATLPHPILVWARQAPEAQLNRILDGLQARGFPLLLPLAMALERQDQSPDLLHFFADNPDLLDGLGEKDPALLGRTGGTLTLRQGFAANETEALYAGAEEIVRREGVNTVIMGHTHEAVTRTEQFSYFNTGSWTRYYRFENDEPTAPWRVLREQSYERFPYSLRYALVRIGAASATVETWHERNKN